MAEAECTANNIVFNRKQFRALPQVKSLVDQKSDQKVSAKRNATDIVAHVSSAYERKKRARQETMSTRHPLRMPARRP